MKENGFDYVDLGLPSGTMWATCNVGATKPEDEGLLFQFGRVDGYRFGDINHNFRTNKQNKQDTGDEFIPKTASGKLYGKNDILDLEDDAAHVNMGGRWRMPTGRFNSSKVRYEGDWGELINNTVQKETTINGVRGILFTSNINGHQLFIPFAGYWHNDTYYHTKSIIGMWSSQVITSSINYAYRLYCNHSSGHVFISVRNRSAALSVRGVFKINNNII